MVKEWNSKFGGGRSEPEVESLLTGGLVSALSASERALSCSCAQACRLPPTVAVTPYAMTASRRPLLKGAPLLTP
jgi:hypothetical protein